MKNTIFLLICAYGILNAQDIKYAQDKPREDLMHYEGFTLSYSEAYELPTWVGYTLTAEHAQQYTGQELDGKYVEDPNIITGSTTRKDYKKSGFVIAQFAPSENFLYSEKALAETYYMSNTAGQKLAFHKYQWKNLEKLIREWAKQAGLVYVVTGPILGKPPFTHIGKNSVVVPDRFYKLVIDIDGGKGIGFVFRNGISSNPIKNFAVSIDEIEELTGIDFFPELSEELQEKLEKEADISKWDFSILED